MYIVHTASSVIFSSFSNFNLMEHFFPGDPFRMTSIGEMKMCNLLEENDVEYNRKLTKAIMVRTYPAGLRTDSSNYTPVMMWNVGCQVGKSTLMMLILLLCHKSSLIKLKRKIIPATAALSFAFSLPLFFFSVRHYIKISFIFFKMVDSDNRQIIPLLLYPAPLPCSKLNILLEHSSFNGYKPFEVFSLPIVCMQILMTYRL